jgi:hypothetical protein
MQEWILDIPTVFRYARLASFVDEGVPMPHTILDSAAFELYVHDPSSIEDAGTVNGCRHGDGLRPSQPSAVDVKP